MGAAFFSTIVFAWTDPTGTPPNNNVSAPINVGSTDQVKNAGLSVNALAVFGNSILSGTSRYLNFGTLVGTTGYGFRDNAGTMEFKHSGGAWTSLSTETDPQVGTLTNGQWCTTDGTSINCTSAAPAGGVSAVTTAQCSTNTWTGQMYICSVNGPAGYFRTGCSISAQLFGFTNQQPNPGGATPSGANGCYCNNSANGATCYAYYAR